MFFFRYDRGGEMTGDTKVLAICDGESHIMIPAASEVNSAAEAIHTAATTS